MNSIGHNFRITIFGESHGKAIGVTIDGIKQGIPLTPDDFRTDLDRRRSGSIQGTTPRHEDDIPEILSGIYNGLTTGTPVTILFRNNDIRSIDYKLLHFHPRPSHADLTAAVKYSGFNDPCGSGMFSGRMTVAIVAAGVVAKKMLPHITFSTCITEIGGLREQSKQADAISEAAAAGDSLGGVVEVTASGVKAGVGEPFFNSVESVAAHLMFSIPGVKGVEFGAGFESARSKGSINNDVITDSKGTTATNNDGGVNGGITNGNDIVMRVAFKPTPSISMPQQTFNITRGEICELIIGGRHDACIALRGAVVVESALAIALADLSLCRNE